MNHIEAMKQALTHEINLVITDPDSKLSGGAQRALQYVHQQIQSIAEAEKQEPVANVVVTKRMESDNYIIDIDLTLAEAGKRLGSGSHDLYTHTQPKSEQERNDLTIAYMCGFEDGKDSRRKREWVGLTDEEVAEIERDSLHRGQAIRAIEAKLKEKNT